MRADFGLDVQANFHPLGFRYGPGVMGPEPEVRTLDAIRPSLRDPGCSGPDPVYAIAMDVFRPEDRAELDRRQLVFGVVAYAAGGLGREPVRSQGHVHARSRFSGWSTPELFEIWQGRAFIYAQEFAADDPGRCIAVDARPGDRVVVPPGWAHAVVSADTNNPLVFGAWCVSDYGFVYDDLRARGGVAWFPLLHADGSVEWEPNLRYRTSHIQIRHARQYPELGLQSEIPLYAHIANAPHSLEWISQPACLAEVWPTFEP
ncbi:MAG TPA: glucose-6-phosphate isomerase family protein [Bryobacteraceae bacterium]|jgi:glucose-6-phosphate isomerase|nr:glucose-6-phosphate isomerase family protein [Bryobacteraceae bacterium]